MCCFFWCSRSRIDASQPRPSELRYRICPSSRASLIAFMPAWASICVSRRSESSVKEVATRAAKMW